MTLYREITDEERRTWSASRYTTISAVPVEPCEHGNYDPHRVEKVGDWTDPYITVRDCPGAGIGGTL